MGLAWYRTACVTALFGASLAAAPLPASAAPEPSLPSLTATMQCDRAAEAGRVRCSIEARAGDGRTIGWADAVLLSLPDFASALKGRIGHADATSREASHIRWALGLVARRAGQGEARARVRAVVCEAAAPSRCVPVTVEVHAIVVVGG
jgi:hypothetical protein